MKRIIGLDIGGANTKICMLDEENGEVLRAKGDSVRHEVWKNPEGLRDVLEDLKISLSPGKDVSLKGIALTMTAELCDVFQSKTQGVVFVLNMVQEVFPDVPVFVWTTRGRFESPAEIKRDPMQAAAANWLASAVALAKSPLLGDETVILADMGSTTTDLLPLVREKVMVKGRTDTERLQSGELVYTGLLRTPIDSIIDHIYIDGVPCRVCNEYFAITADVYRLLGRITEKEYDVPTPDGGSCDLPGCARRLARAVSAEPEELGMEKVCWMARYIQEKQIEQIMDSICQMVSRRELSMPQLMVATGQGRFILEEAALRLSWKTVPWWKMIPGAGNEQVMTAYAVAWLLANYTG